jgi:hypothetical protein
MFEVDDRLLIVSIICSESQSAGAELPGILRLPGVREQEDACFEDRQCPELLSSND